MVAVAQLVRALGCGPSGCEFKSHQPPWLKKRPYYGGVFVLKLFNIFVNMNYMDSKLKQSIINEWAGGLPIEKQIIVLFEKVRDIPYGEIGSRDPEEVYRNNKGTCSGKHELLKELYQELGIKTKDFIAMHRFKDLKVNFPDSLKEILERSDIIDPHNFFKILVDGKWLTIDITWDKPLARVGFSVNENWDGKSDMEICVVPLNIIETDNPIEFKKQEIAKLSEKAQEDRKLFLKELTKWANTIRNS